MYNCLKCGITGTGVPPECDLMHCQIEVTPPSRKGTTMSLESKSRTVGNLAEALSAAARKLMIASNPTDFEDREAAAMAAGIAAGVLAAELVLTHPGSDAEAAQKAVDHIEKFMAAVGINSKAKITEVAEYAG